LSFPAFPKTHTKTHKQQQKTRENKSQEFSEFRIQDEPGDHANGKTDRYHRLERRNRGGRGGGVAARHVFLFFFSLFLSLRVLSSCCGQKKEAIFHENPKHLFFCFVTIVRGTDTTNLL